MDDSKKEDERKNSLRCSVLDGSFHAAMVGFGESFFSAFAVFLKATSIQLGLLGSLPMMLGSVFQVWSTKLISLFGSRKRFVLFGAFMQGVMFIPVALVFFMGDFRVFHLILFICLYWLFGSMISPAWNSWMGDLVFEKERGDYFGRRNNIAGMVSFVAFVSGGYILQNFTDGEMTQYIGFVLLFVLAFFSRIFSLVYLFKQHEPKFEFVASEQFSFWEFICKARFHNYGLFVIYLGVMNFAVYIAAPFFTPYMLNDLDLSYAEFTLVVAISIVVKFISMPVWGKLSDTYGTKKVLTVSGIMMPIVPVLWIFSSDIWYLVVIQMYNGFAWAGFEIASFNFIFDSTTSQKRATCVAYYNVVTGVMIFAGAMFGSLLIEHIPVGWSDYYIVFLVSYFGRSIASIIFLPHLKERRDVEKISNGDLLVRFAHMLPASGMMHHLITFMHHDKKEGKK